jgi:tripeptide aminopeptidase
MISLMLTSNLIVAVLLLATPLLHAQSSWFQLSLLEKPEMQKALQSVDDRAAGIVDEWIRLVEIPAPSGKEQARAKYVRAEMEKLGLSEIKTDDMLNVSGVRGERAAVRRWYLPPTRIPYSPTEPN